jgi:hypothetical protein
MKREIKRLQWHTLRITGNVDIGPYQIVFLIASPDVHQVVLRLLAQ